MNIEDFALTKLKQIHKCCLYMLSRAYVQKQKNIVDWQLYRKMRRIECTFQTIWSVNSEPIDMTRIRYVALFEGKPDARLYDEIRHNMQDCQSEKQIEEHIKKLASTFDDCAVRLRGFKKWINNLDWGDYEGADRDVLYMWDRLNYCIMQFNTNIKSIAKRYKVKIQKD